MELPLPHGHLCDASHEPCAQPTCLDLPRGKQRVLILDSDLRLVALTDDQQLTTELLVVLSYQRDLQRAKLKVGERGAAE